MLLTNLPSLTFPGTLVIASGKTATINNTLTLVGTDGTTLTFPGTSATIARTDAGQTFTGAQTITEPVGASGLTITGNTQTTSFPALSVTQAWNAGAQTFTAIKLNVTNTASANGSKLLDLQVGAATQAAFTVHAGTPKGLWLVGNNGVIVGANSVGDPDGGVLIGIHASGMGLFLRSDSGMVGWSPGTNPNSASDVILRRGAANVLDLRNGTNTQAFRPHGYFNSATSFATGLVQCAKAAVTLTGASTATGNIIPAGAFVIGVATTTTTTITNASGYQVGDGADADRYGDITGTAVGTDSDNTDATANPTGYNAAASAITLTAKTADFTGGVIQVVVFYLSTSAD